MNHSSATIDPVAVHDQPPALDIDGALASRGFFLAWSDQDGELLIRPADGRRLVCRRAPFGFEWDGAFLRRAREAMRQHPHPGVATWLGEVEHDDLLLWEARAEVSMAAFPSPLPATLVAYVGLRVAEALAHVHRHVGVHRSLHPGQLLVSRDGEIRIVGLEEARLHERFPSSTQLPGHWIRYLAPEVIDDVEAAPAWAPPVDVFALGACLWQWTAGRPRFGDTGRTTMPVILSALRDIQARQHRPSPPWVPAPLARALDRALAPDPTARLAVDDLAAALRAALDCDLDLARHALAMHVEHVSPATNVTPRHVRNAQG